jgi:hypothetical protein
LTGRYTATPSQDVFDFSESNSVTQNFPRSGPWYILAENTGDMNVTFYLNFTIQTCSLSASDGCPLVTIYEDSPLLEITLMPNETYYFQYPNSNSLFAVVGNSDNNKSPPSMYASIGQLPVGPQSDISDCNQANCYITNRIIIPNTNFIQNNTLPWYLAVRNDREYYPKPIQIAIWFNQYCAPRCDIRGSCITDGIDTGFCECTADTYYGIDCYEVKTEFGIDYLVLVILAGVLGFCFLVGTSLFYCVKRTDPSFSVQ